MDCNGFNGSGTCLHFPFYYAPLDVPIPQSISWKKWSPLYPINPITDTGNPYITPSACISPQRNDAIPACPPKPYLTQTIDVSNEVIPTSVPAGPLGESPEESRFRSLVNYHHVRYQILVDDHYYFPLFSGLQSPVVSCESPGCGNTPRIIASPSRFTQSQPSTRPLLNFPKGTTPSMFLIFPLLYLARSRSTAGSISYQIVSLLTRLTAKEVDSAQCAI